MREVDRVEVIREVLGRRLRQGEASQRPGICVRRVKRLVRRYREEGARGLRSRRGRRRVAPCHQWLSPTHSPQGDITALLKRGHLGFGLTA